MTSKFGLLAKKLPKFKLSISEPHEHPKHTLLLIERDHYSKAYLVPHHLNLNRNQLSTWALETRKEFQRFSKRGYR